MIQILVVNIMLLLHQALMAVLVAAVGRYLARIIKIRAKKPRPHRFRIDLGVTSVAVVITTGGTRQERKALNDTESESRDR
jgi:hypothetical protein